MSERADYISIGQHIAHTIGEDTWSNAILECEGKDFCETLAPDVSPRMLLKQLRFNMLGYELLERALVMMRDAVSKPILISENGAHCTVTVVNTDNPELLKGKPFYMTDALVYFKKYVVNEHIGGYEDSIIMLRCTDYDYAMFMDTLYRRTAKLDNMEEGNMHDNSTR